VSPRSEAGSAATSLFPPSAPRAVPDEAALKGTWLLKGTGTILGITSSGAFILQDLGTMTQAETGTVAVEQDGSAVFTTDGAANCPATYDSVVTRGNSFDAHLVAGSCTQLGSTTDAWIRLN
jgi:hypothetical protein